jgi:hypothetical protein
MKPEDLKTGDRVRVTFEGEMGTGFVWLGDTTLGIAEFLLPHASSLELLPPLEKELEVGEEVFWKGDGPYTVFAHHGNLAWLTLAGNDGPNSCLHNVSDLRRPDGRPIKVG